MENHEEAQTPTEVVKSVEELTAEIAKLTKELEFAQEENSRVSRWWTALERSKEQLDEYLTENWDDLGDHAEPIAEMFGLDAEVEKEVSVEISGTMTIKAPRGYDWDDLRYASFTTTIEADWGADFTIESYDLEVGSTEVD